MPESSQAAMKKIADSLRAAAELAKKLREVAGSADTSIDLVDKESK